MCKCFANTSVLWQSADGTSALPLEQSAAAKFQMKSLEMKWHQLEESDKKFGENLNLSKFKSRFSRDESTEQERELTKIRCTQYLGRRCSS